MAMMVGGLNIFSTFTLFIGYTICQNVFRDDYANIGSSFYKYHKTMLNIEKATEACEMEGTILFYPETEEEMSSAWLEWARKEVGLIERNLLLGGYVLNETTKETTTVDNKTFSLPFTIRRKPARGEQLCLYLSLNNTHMEITSYPCNTFYASFFCKKPKGLVQWNEKCNMPFIPSNGNDYEYDSKLGKCYKLHTKPNTWHKAIKICKAEQSDLTELNSQKETDHVVKLVTKVPEENVGAVCLGFQKIDKVGWRMLSGTFLHESGYAMWAHTQPDGGEFELFGAMAYNGRLHDIGAKARCIFVCERDVKKTP